MATLLFLVFVLSCVIFLYIHIRVQEQKKGTTSEKIGTAICEIAHGTARTVSSIAFSLTESTEHKNIRLAEETVADRNTDLYYFDLYGNEEYLQRKFTIDNNLKQALNTLDIAEDTWKRVAMKLFYIGTIKKMAYGDKRGFKDKLNKSYREVIVKGGFYMNGKFIEKRDTKYLFESLDYFNIPHKEWIDYGDVVIDMHNLNDDKEIKECGYILKVCVYDPGADN